MKKLISTVVLGIFLILAYNGVLTPGSNAEDESAAVIKEEPTAEKLEEEKLKNIEQKSGNKKEENIKPTPTNNIEGSNIVKAFQEANLSLVDPRDNTKNQCGPGNMNCTQLITTEDVSIFIWPSTDDATKVGSEYHDHTVENITIRFNEPLSPEEDYISTLDTLIENN